MTLHTQTPWKWHTEFKSDERIGSVFAEPREGHAYAIAMQPKYQTKEQWDADAALIVRSVNTLPALAKAMENLLRFVEEGSVYELQHPSDYSAYLNAKAELSALRADKQ